MEEEIQAIAKIIKKLAPHKNVDETIKEYRRAGSNEKQILKILVGSLYDWLAYGN